MQMNIISDSMNASYEKDRDLSNKRKQWQYVKKYTNASNTIKRKWNSFLDNQILVMQKSISLSMQRKNAKYVFFNFSMKRSTWCTNYMKKNENKH